MKNNKHFKHEQTLVIIKPDGIQRALVGEVIKRYERIGLKLVGIKMLVPNEDKVEQHYTLDPEWKNNVGQKTLEGYKKKGIAPPSEDPLELADTILNSLKTYLTSSPVIVMVWEGAHAVEIVRKITGGTEPLTSDVGTIRGDFVMDSYQMSDTDGRSVRNIVHASGSIEEAKDEIKHWFSDDELIKYKTAHEKILYDVDFKDLLE